MEGIADPAGDKFIDRIYEVSNTSGDFQKGDYKNPMEWSTITDNGASILAVNLSMLVDTRDKALLIKSSGYNSILLNYSEPEFYPLEIVEENNKSVLVLKFDSTLDQMDTFMDIFSLNINDTPYNKGSKNIPLEYEVHKEGNFYNVYICKAHFINEDNTIISLKAPGYKECTVTYSPSDDISVIN